MEGGRTKGRVQGVRAVGYGERVIGEAVIGTGIDRNSEKQKGLLVLSVRVYDNVFLLTDKLAPCGAEGHGTGCAIGRTPFAGSVYKVEISEFPGELPIVNERDNGLRSICVTVDIIFRHGKQIPLLIYNLGELIVHLRVNFAEIGGTGQINAVVHTAHIVPQNKNDCGCCQQNRGEQ